MAESSSFLKGVLIAGLGGLATWAGIVYLSSGKSGTFAYVALRIDGPHTGPIDQPVYLAAKASRVSGVEDDVSARTTWSSEDPSIATISGGTIHPVKTGTTRIRGVFQELPAELLLTIEPSRVASFEISGPSSFTVGDDASVFATVSQSGGVRRSVTSEAQWESSNSNVLSVGPNGQVHPTAPGTCEIRATYDGRTTGLPVVVREVGVTRLEVPRSMRLLLGDVVTVPVSVRLSNGRVQAIGADVEWTSDNSSVVEGVAPGRFRSVGQGTAVVTARYRDQLGQTQIVVEAQSAPPPPPQAPGGMILAKGTIIGVRTSAELSTHGLPLNALVPAVLTSDITAESGLISRASGPAEVRVAAYRPPGRNESPFIRLTLQSIQGPGGRRLVLQSDFVDLKKPSFFKGLFRMAAGTAAGAATGAAINGKKGAAIGAAAGATIATAYVLLDKGDHLVLNPGAVVVFHTTEAVRIVR